MIREQPPCPLSVSLYMYRVSRPFGPRIIISRMGNLGLGSSSSLGPSLFYRSGNFWRMRAALGLACAQAATLGTQVVGRPRSRPRYAARPRH